MSRLHFAYKQVNPEIRLLAGKYHYKPEAILEIFEALQNRYRYLSSDSIIDVAAVLNMPVARVEGMATFYSMVATAPKETHTLRLCDGPACWMEGSKFLLESAEKYLENGWAVERTSCLGLCDRAPAGWADGLQCGPIRPELFSNDKPKEDKSGSFFDFLSKTPPNPSYRVPLPDEQRVMLSKINEINPKTIESAIDQGVYSGLESVLGKNSKYQRISPRKVIEEVKNSGVRGRGGAGFPIGVKWDYVAKQERVPKYVICNADESEPLVFKDRVLIESNPHQLLEGMAIAAYSVGAQEGFIYIRGEYEPQAKILENAIKQALDKGLLGNRILETDFNFHLHLHRGAGAYICGEETALLESLEGKRGEPRVRPPYPTISGYRGLPTIVNNVESFASIPKIILYGSEWYKGLSESVSPGTKLFMITGHVNRPGIFEAPYGLTLREMIDKFSGGMRTGSKFHFALSGGAAGTIIPESLLDVPIDYESQNKGISLGAGAFLICDQSISPVVILRELMHFFEVESCGKCTPCRIGTRQTREILDRLLTGSSHSGDLKQLENLGEMMKKTSFCGLGQSTALPIKSVLKHFRDNFEV